MLKDGPMESRWDVFLNINNKRENRSACHCNLKRSYLKAIYNLHNGHKSMFKYTYKYILEFNFCKIVITYLKVTYNLCNGRKSIFKYT